MKYIETSALSGLGVHETFENISIEILKNMYELGNN